ncbi:O-antigen ligase family protein [Azospirillum sp.]|uniref:O-antigen ligase family protein n=1 Tax=Azospirillum sp. TaxID=34012 RepID=UPI002D27F1E9|nr:O-antigen ligase family protein [Azospirillum sp.]HYD69846.1 O-antigen ligase family protein [Azospirillum sp.]
MLLVGYVLGGRGFAHVGVPPIYVGEVVLLLSLVLYLCAPDFRIFADSRILWLLIAFDLWCLSRSLPHLEEYGVDTLRDSALYGYSAFAFIVASLMNDRHMVRGLVIAFDRALSVSVVLLPLFIVMAPRLANGPIDYVPFILLKAGDVAVHLSGVLAFRLLRLREAMAPGHPLPRWLPDWLFWSSWMAAALWVIAGARGGLLAMAAGILVVFLFGYGRRPVALFVAALVGVLTVMAVFGIRIETERREISAEQILANVLSITGERPADAVGIDAVELESTATWRLLWWEDILDYTLFGEYFWTGKGFGENLADSDGYQVSELGDLRSPHNGHLTVLARAGVPGLVLWGGLHVAFVTALIRMAIRMKHAGADAWQRANVWILATWAAAAVNATFDVYLEGPQGGIWYWSIIGTGLAVLAVERRMLMAQAGGTRAGVLRPRAVS